MADAKGAAMAKLLAIFLVLLSIGAVQAQRPQRPQQLKQLLKFQAERAEATKKAEAERAATEAAKKAELAKASELAAQQKKLDAVASIAGGKQDAVALAKHIDRRIDGMLAEHKFAPSAISGDAEFLRRVTLDITGVMPTYEKATAFLSDTSPEKRSKLLDELLASTNYGRKQADIWLAKLFAKDSGNRFVQAQPFYEWIEKAFNANEPWDKFVSSIVTATGKVEDHPEVTYFLANRSLDKLTDTTTQHFLGVRLGCAQCHDHPFTETKQSEYWAMAAFYSKVKADRPKNIQKGSDNNDISVSEGTTATRAKDFIPEGAKQVSAKYYGGATPALNPKEPYRPDLANWMTSKTNPYFARAMVNRTWAQLFGRGFVDPVDDMIDTHTPSHPELLAELAKHFAETGFDIKYLHRAICLSNAYQRTSRPTEANRDDASYFSHQSVKQMSGTQLYDSMMLLKTPMADTKANAKADAKADKTKSGPANDRERFAVFYLGGAEETHPLDYEAGIPQALKLMNAKSGPLNMLAKSWAIGVKPEAFLDKLYLALLARKPTDEERTRLLKYIRTAGPIDAPGDVLWAVMNSSEFKMVK